MSAHDYGFAVSPASRIELPTPEQMTPDQRAVHDDVVNGVRGRMVGPLRAVIHSPELAQRWHKIGEFLRYQTVLPEVLKELAILVCGRRWNSDLEWAVHSRVAKNAGIDPSIITALEAAQPIRFADREQYEIYGFARLLLQHGQVSDHFYDAIRVRWGERGVVELTGIVGYYSMVAMMVNAHLVPVPDGEGPGIRPLGAALTALPEGELTS